MNKYVIKYLHQILYTSAHFYRKNGTKLVVGISRQIQWLLEHFFTGFVESNEDVVKIKLSSKCESCVLYTMEGSYYKFETIWENIMIRQYKCKS